MVEYATYPSLKDRIVFVTGGGAGIGGNMVQLFAKQGSKVGFIDINAEWGAANVQACVDAGCAHKPVFVQGDIRNIDALNAAIDQTRNTFGDIQVLVNNAANDDRHVAEEVTPEYWRKSFETNLDHQFFGIQAVMPDMRRSGGGSIINIGSSSWMIKEDFFPAYAVAKSAVQGLTRTMAHYLGKDNIRVNSVVPGWVVTDRQLDKWWTQEGEDGCMDMQCLKKRVYPEEFNQMVLFLAADDGGACTSQSYVVDAGRAGLDRKSVV